MKKVLPLVLGLSFAFGTVVEAQAQIGLLVSGGVAAAQLMAKKKKDAAAKVEADKAAANQAAAADNAVPGTVATTTVPPAASTANMVDLDLAASGLPVALKVPAGTTVKKDSEYSDDVRLVGPRFAISVSQRYGGYESGLADLARYKKQEQDLGRTKVLLDEPTGYRLGDAEGMGSDMFTLLLGTPEGENTYLVSLSFIEPFGDNFTANEINTMFASARTARLTAALKPAAKFRKFTAPSTDLITADLSKYKIPLTLRVPRGTVFSESPMGVRMVAGDNFALVVNRHIGSAASADRAFAYDKKNATRYATFDQKIVDEPRTYHLRNTAAEVDDTFGVLLVDATNLQYYMISPSVINLDEMAPIEPTMGTANMDAQFAAARSAKLKAPAAPAKK